MEKNIYTIFIRKECRSIKNDKIVVFNDSKIGECIGIVKTILQIYGGEIGTIRTSEESDCWEIIVRCEKDTYDKIVEMIKNINSKVFPDLCVDVKE